MRCRLKRRLSSRLRLTVRRFDKAKLDLAYTTITSPVDGLIGTTQKKVGSLVGRGENTLLNTISQVNPILFRCAIAEAEYLRLARRGAD